jgi:Tfp pilus assembly protein PilF
MASAKERAEQLNEVGVGYTRSQAWEQALDCFLAAAAMDPEDPHWHRNCALALMRLNRHEEALVPTDRALALDPQYRDARQGRVAILQKLGRWADALAEWEKIPPGANLAEHCRFRGEVLAKLKRFDEALDSFTQALTIDPGYVPALVDRGNEWSARDRLDKAFTDLNLAIAIDPLHTAAYLSRSIAYKAQLFLEAAKADIALAIAINKDEASAYWSKSHILLMEGDFLNGWPLYSWRLALGTTREMISCPLWTGTEDLAGKDVLLYTEQGYGDTFQFCRYASLVKDLGANVLLLGPEQTRDVVRTVDPRVRVESWIPLPAKFDYQSPLMSLPAALKTTVDTIPARVPYLFADPGLVRRWAETLGPRRRLRVGFALAGNPDHNEDRRRSIPLPIFAPLFGVEADFHFFQLTVSPEERAELAYHPNVQLQGQHLSDFSQTAALIENLDLVIAVDTAVVHLAGAMGKPVWVLLSYCPDYRWLLGRMDSPWYPTARLFRQPTFGDWGRVIDAVASALRELS